MKSYLGIVLEKCKKVRNQRIFIDSFVTCSDKHSTKSISDNSPLYALSLDFSILEYTTGLSLDVSSSSNMGYLSHIILLYLNIITAFPYC